MAGSSPATQYCNITHRGQLFSFINKKWSGVRHYGKTWKIHRASHLQLPSRYVLSLNNLCLIQLNFSLIQDFPISECLWVHSRVGWHFFTQGKRLYKGLYYCLGILLQWFTCSETDTSWFPTAIDTPHTQIFSVNFMPFERRHTGQVWWLIPLMA